MRLVAVFRCWETLRPFGAPPFCGREAGGGSQTLLEGWGVAGWLVGLVSDGIIAGVGAVLGFVPQMLVLFLLLAILEDCGYMARIAFIMDRIFRKFGLSGKSFIPMLVALIVAVVLALCLLYLLFRPYKESTRLTEKVPAGA